jgi:5-methylthioadenosine/S-adenosylhomocysteine deaminase
MGAGMTSITEREGPRLVDILVFGCDIVTVDERNTVIRNGAVAIDAGRIVWLGKTEDAPARYRARTAIDGAGRIALPGLIDAHFHTAQQLLRGKLAEIGRTRQLKQPIWKSYLIPFESVLEPEDVYLSGLVGYTNMLRVGTTCFAEAGGPHPDEMGKAALEVGIRGFIALSTVDQTEAIGADVPQSMMMTADEAYDRNVALVNRWKDKERVKAWLALRQIIVCSPGLIKGIAAAARDLDVKIHTHLCEGTYEIDYAGEKFGKRPTEYLEDLGVLSHHLHCAHSVLLSPEEVDLYVKHRLSACHCALNNYAIGVPRLIEMWRRGIDIGLGSDGAAWGTLDIFQIAHAARVAQQAVGGTPWHIRTPLSSEQLLRIATEGGARALGLNREVASIEVGKRADLILCDATELDQAPVYDPLFAASNVVVGRDVRTVVIDGKLVMKEREILTVDVEAIHAKLAVRRPIIMERFDKLVA